MLPIGERQPKGSPTPGSTPVQNPFIAKLRNGAELTDSDEAALLSGITAIRTAEAEVDLVREGAPTGTVRLILDGIAYRYKSVPSGRRQIMAFLLPGDLCDLQIPILGVMDHGIRTLTRCEVAHISQPIVDGWTERPRVNRALLWSTLVDEAIMREWIVNLGARPADQRVAHLLLELLHRLKSVGLATDKGYALPLSQQMLGECSGLSAVHANRVVTRLRHAGFVNFQRHRVAITDVGALSAMAGFDPSYLHLKRLNAAPGEQK